MACWTDMKQRKHTFPLKCFNMAVRFAKSSVSLLNDHTAGGEQRHAPMSILRANLCGHSNQVGNFIIAEPSPEQGISLKKQQTQTMQTLISASDSHHKIKSKLTNTLTLSVQWTYWPLHYVFKYELLDIWAETTVFKFRSPTHPGILPTCTGF